MPGAKTKQASSNIGVSKSTPGLVSTHREDAESTPRARISVRPKLARSLSPILCWESPSGRQKQRETGEVALLVLSRGFPPASVSSRVPEAHSHTLGKHCWFGTQSY
jgi:hypothetical protein